MKDYTLHNHSGKRRDRVPQSTPESVQLELENEVGRNRTPATTSAWHAPRWAQSCARDSDGLHYTV